MCSLKIESLGFANDQAEIDPRSGDLWFFDGPALCRFSGGAVERVHLFDGDRPGRLIHFTPQGWILVGHERSGEVHLSKDGGAMFEAVLKFDNPTSFALNWAVEEWDGQLLLGEYNLERGRSANIHRSFDGGRTWAILHRFSGHRHIHMIRRDPYRRRLYISTGDKHKNTYTTSNLRTFERIGQQNSGLMSIGFSPAAVYFGTDLRSGNHIMRDDRKGGSVQRELEPPRDQMVYDFAWIGERMVAACRLAHNLEERAQNKPCILDADTLEEVSGVETFYFTRAVGGVLYTARTSETLKIEAVL